MSRCRELEREGNIPGRFVSGEKLSRSGEDCFRENEDCLGSGELFLGDFASGQLGEKVLFGERMCGRAGGLGGCVRGGQRCWRGRPNLLLVRVLIIQMKLLAVSVNFFV